MRARRGHRSRALLLSAACLAAAFGVAPASGWAENQALLIGEPPANTAELTQLWARLEKGYGFAEVRIAMAGSPHEIGEDLRQFLSAPGRADDLRLVWIAAPGAASSAAVCPAWSEAYVRPQVPTILVAPTCIKFLVQAPSTYEQLADADGTIPAPGLPGVVFVSTTAQANDDPAELVSALMGRAPQDDEASSTALVGALACALKDRISVDYSPSSSAWRIVPPLCPGTDTAPDLSAAVPAEPSPAISADASAPPATGALPFPPPPRPDAEAVDVPEMPAVPPVPVAAAPLPEVGAPSFASPVDGKIVADFGSQIAGKASKGVDYEAPAGTAVRAAESGKVVYVGELPGYGKVIAIKHGNDWATVYGHTSDISVTKGQMVTRGQDIAQVDPTTRRLHFEVRRQGRPVDPLPMIASASP